MRSILLKHEGDKWEIICSPDVPHAEQLTKLIELGANQKPGVEHQMLVADERYKYDPAVAAAQQAWFADKDRRDKMLLRRDELKREAEAKARQEVKDDAADLIRLTEEAEAAKKVIAANKAKEADSKKKK